MTPNTHPVAVFYTSRPPKGALGIAYLILFVLVCAIYFNLDLYQKVGTADAPDLFFYISFYQRSQSFDLQTMINSTRWELGYCTISWLFAQTGVDFWWYGLAIKMFVLGSYVFMARVVLGGVLFPAIAAIAFVLFMYESYSTNVLRQGISVSFVFLSFALLMQGRWKTATILGVIAVLCHISAIVFIAACVAGCQRKFLIPLRALAAVSAINLALYAFNWWTFFAEPVTRWLEYLGFRYAMYGNDLFTPYAIGFKLSFFLASFGAIVSCSTLLYLKNRTVGENDMIIVTLLITNAYLMASGFPYYDRIGSLSWMLAPIICCLVMKRALIYLTELLD